MGRFDLQIFPEQPAFGSDTDMLSQIRFGAAVEFFTLSGLILATLVAGGIHQAASALRSRTTTRYWKAMDGGPGRPISVARSPRRTSW